MDPFYKLKTVPLAFKVMIASSHPGQAEIVGRNSSHNTLSSTFPQQGFAAIAMKGESAGCDLFRFSESAVHAGELFPAQT